MKNLLNCKIAIVFALSLITSFGAKAQNNVIDEVVWVVGDEIILKSDVEQARLAALYEGTTFDRDPYCVIPEELAVQKLFLHQAKLDSIEVTDAEAMGEVDRYLEMYIQQFGSKERVEQQFNKPFIQIREELKEREKNKLIIYRMRQKLIGDIKVTPSEVRSYFSKIPKDSLPYVPTKVEVQILVMNPKIEQSEIDDVKKRLREYTDRVNKGEIAFSSLALLYSEDKASAMRGGEIGFEGRGTLDQAYATAAFALKDKNKVSKIVESEFGYHIIQLVEKRGDRINTRHILIRPKVSEAEIAKTTAKLDSIATDIREKKFTFEEAVPLLSQDKATKNNHGIMIYFNEDNYMNSASFPMDRLPQEVSKVVSKMNVDDVSNAFTMIDAKTGKNVCAIIKLKKRIDGHKANITEDYQLLKSIVLEKKREEKIQKWIVAKQKNTYVRINDVTRKCDFKYPGWNISRK
ncbi:MAG: peptidylprolyl isomerase [Bacteroides sp.]|nr:peptidylprolyl isomerase [Bacteroides sp.]